MEHFSPRPGSALNVNQSPLESHDSWLPDRFECCMCSDLFIFDSATQQAVTLTCGHSVCRQCLIWVPHKCPTCRKPFTEDANIMEPDCALRDAMLVHNPVKELVTDNAKRPKVPVLNVWSNGKLQNKQRESPANKKWKLSDVQVSSSKPGVQAPPMAAMFIKLFGDVYVDKTAEQFRAVRDAVAVLNSKPVPEPGIDDHSPWQVSDLSTYPTRRTGSGIHGWLSNIVSNLREVRRALKDNTARLEKQFETDVSTRIRDALDQQQHQDMPQATPRFESARLLKELITDMAIAALVVKEQIRSADPEGHSGGTRTSEAARIANLMAFMDAVSLPYHPLRVQYVEKLMNDMNNETASKALGRPLWEDNHKEYWGEDVDAQFYNTALPVKQMGVTTPLAKQNSNVVALEKQKSLKGGQVGPAGQSVVQQLSTKGKDNLPATVPVVGRKDLAKKEDTPVVTTLALVQKGGGMQAKGGRESTTPISDIQEEVGEEGEEERYDDEGFEEGDDIPSKPDVQAVDECSNEDEEDMMAAQALEEEFSWDQSIAEED